MNTKSAVTGEGEAPREQQIKEQELRETRAWIRLDDAQIQRRCGQIKGEIITY